MELRPELTPPPLDKALVDQLAHLVARIDGAPPGCREDAAEFSRLVGVDLPSSLFQGVCSGDHVDWVRSLLYYRCIKAAGHVTREELIEVVRRAMPQNGHPQFEAYQMIFDANVPLEAASALISYPPDYEPETNTRSSGLPLAEYDPTPEQIVEWALSSSPPGG